MKDLILIITGVPIKVNRIVCQESNANYKTLTKINHIVITQQNDVNQSTSALWASANAKKPGLFLTLCVRVIDLSRVGQRIVMLSADVHRTSANAKKEPGSFLTLCVRVIDLSRVGQRIVTLSADVHRTSANVKKESGSFLTLCVRVTYLPGTDR